MNWDQIRTVLWLRWRLTRNQWTRSRGLGTVIAIIVTTLMGVLSAGAFAGGFAAGAFGLRDAKPEPIKWVLFGLTVGFIFIWIVGLLTELQRSETIDLQRLMHLPVALQPMFIINYLATHLVLSVALVVPAVIGLALGLAFGGHPLLFAIAPLFLSMVFMITAWTYCLRGWLAALMANPRRRRTVIMVITFAFILVGQGPNLLFNVLPRVAASQQTGRRASRERQQAQMEALKHVSAFAKFIPPLWVPIGARVLTEGNVWPGLAAFLGCAAIGAAGLHRAYRTTIKFYYGEPSRKALLEQKAAAEPLISPEVAQRRVRLLEMSLPGVPEQAAALATAFFRSMLRAPEVKMAWATSFIVILIVGASVFLRTTAKLPEVARPFVSIAPVGFSLLMLIQFLTNQFGFDREGFRALVLSPVDRRLILLGKNLACLPVAATSGLLLVTLTSIWLRNPPLTIITTLFQLITLLLLGGLAGNLLSILVPYRIQAGSMKPTKLPPLAMIVLVFCQLLFPLVMLPVFIPPLAELLWRGFDFPPGVPVNLILSALFAVGMALIYWITLEPLGQLLQRRETRILGRVTEEVE